MNIGRLNVRITFQKNDVVIDEIGNHTNKWVDYYSCYASTSTKRGDEMSAIGQIVVSEELDFTVRFSSEVANILPDRYRIRLLDRTYNIKSVDDMAFKHNSIKFHTELERK